MNRKQKQIFSAGLVIAALALLFPPWIWDGVGGVISNPSKMDTDAWGIAYGAGLNAPPVVLTSDDCRRMICGDPPRTKPVLIMPCYPLLAVEIGSLAVVVSLLCWRSRYAWTQEEQKIR